MSSAISEVVREAVARHLAVPAWCIELSARIREDLDLDPLDLALIALRVEESEGIEFPMARLEQAQTVGEIAVIAREATSADSRVALLSA